MGASLIIIGIDGATFDLMEPWVEAGSLPVIGRLMAEGTYGDLISTYPPLTAPAWSSFMTGANPGRHGVFDFLTSDLDSENVVDARALRLPTVWHLLSGVDRRVGVVNVPVTYPPSALNGKVITGTLSSSDPDRSAYPVGLIQELEERTGRRWWHRDRRKYAPSRPLDFLQAMKESNRTITAFAGELLRSEEFDVFMVMLDIVDAASHFFWHFMDPSHPFHEDRGEDFANGVLSAYRLVDECVGRLLQAAGPGCDALLVSDHGFGPVDGMVNLNNFLMERGYLALKKSGVAAGKRLLRSAGLTPAHVMRALERFHLDSLVMRVPKGLRNRVIGTMGSYREVDWERTLCYSRGHLGQVYFTDRVRRNRVLYRQRRRAVVEDLRENLRDPQTGEALVSDVVPRERMYEGPYADRGPDLFLVMRDWRCVAYPLFSSGPELVIPCIQENHYANHRMNGIFCACGPSFAGKGRVAESSITDVAPTILYLRDVPIPPHMDGRALEKVIAERLWRERTPERSEQAVAVAAPAAGAAEEHEQRERRERLRGLGYL
ncbi:MAG: alkaline phosphatase family protein [Candidatus Brocadiaceae bacterium]|jgi:predicted AlkP superfamily phosphohydrolase/phosphomutase